MKKKKNKIMERKYKTTKIFMISTNSISEMVIADNEQEAKEVFMTKHHHITDFSISETSFRPIMESN